MYLWALLPLLFAEIVFGFLASSSVSTAIQSGTILSNPSLTQAAIQVASAWPFFDGLPYTLIWTYFGAFVRTALGSTNTTDLQTFAATSFDSALIVALAQGSVAKIGPFGLGVMYFQGPSNVQISYSLGNQLIQSFLDPVAFTCVPLNQLVGTITLSRASETLTQSFADVRIWSEEYLRPSFGSYAMEVFLEGRNAMSLQFTEINSTILITKVATTQVYTITMDELYKPLDAVSFVTIVNRSIAAVMGPNIIEVSFLDVGSNTANAIQPPRNIVQGILRWRGLEIPSVVYTVSVPTTTDQIRDATAATFGLYNYSFGDPKPTITTITFQGSSVTNICLQRVILQWPISFTQAYANVAPGSADTDGQVNYWTSGSLPLIPFFRYPSNIFTPGGRQHQAFYDSTCVVPVLNCTYAFSSSETGTFVANLQLDALDATTQTVDLYNVYLVDPEPGNGPLQALFTQYYSETVQLVFEGQTITDVLSNLFFEANGVWTLLAPLNLPVTLTQDLYDDVNVSASLQTSTGEPLLDLYMTLQVRTHTKYAVRYLPLDTKLNLFTMAPGSTLWIQGWAGGGGSITLDTTAHYGGASSRCQAILDIDADGLHYFEVFVGRKGSQVNTAYATGGQNTFVILNTTNLMQIGGGGGATSTCHGGAGGATSDLSVSTLVANTEPTFYYGFSGSTEPFTNTLIDLTQVQGPASKPTEETFQGSGAGALMVSDPVIRGDDGYLEVGLNITGGRPAATGGSGAQGLYDWSYYTTFGGTGVSNTTELIVGKGTSLDTVLGAGGGGATMFCTFKAHYGFNITNLQLNPSYVLNGVPSGGGSNLAPPYFDLTFISNESSLLSFALTETSFREVQTQWTKAMLEGCVRAIADNVETTVDLPSSYINPYNWILLSPSDFIATVLGAIPIGPNDGTWPNTRGPNVRLVGANEDILLNNNILCIINDGQISESLAGLSIGTSFSGPFVPSNTIVTAIEFGASQPQGLYNAIYLTLSNDLTVTTGPFTWNYKTVWPLGEEPPSFANGIQFQGLPKTIGPNFFDVSKSLTEISPTLTQQLVNALYEAMPHTWIANKQPVFFSPLAQIYFPNEFVLPSDTVAGPSYLQQLWPVTRTTENDIMRAHIFFRPAYFPLQPSIPQTQTETIFDYTGSILAYTVPNNAITTTVYAFGGGATAVPNSSFTGSDASFVQATFGNLAGRTLDVFVGQGADVSAVPSFGPLSGGLSGAYLTGGGLSGIYDTLSNSFLVIAAGGGGAGRSSNGVFESTPQRRPSPSALDGTVGAAPTGQGQSTTIDLIGAGGSGLFGGTTGRVSYSGAAGSSLVPTNGMLSTVLESKPYWSSQIGHGSKTGIQAGHGRVVLVHTF